MRRMPHSKPRLASNTSSADGPKCEAEVPNMLEFWRGRLRTFHVQLPQSVTLRVRRRASRPLAIFVATKDP
jgi:hypothetical protein